MCMSNFFGNFDSAESVWDDGDSFSQCSTSTNGCYLDDSFNRVVALVHYNFPPKMSPKPLNFLTLDRKIIKIMHFLCGLFGRF
jgi:hypothetical protein